MSTFELCLPAMVVGVYEAGADDLVGTVDDFGTFGRSDVVCNPYNLSIIDQEVCGSWDDMILCVVYEESAVLEEDGV